MSKAMNQKEEEVLILAYHVITLKPRGLGQGWNFTMRSTASVDGRMDATWEEELSVHSLRQNCELFLRH